VTTLPLPFTFAFTVALNGETEEEDENMRKIGDRPRIEPVTYRVQIHRYTAILTRSVPQISNEIMMKIKITTSVAFVYHKIHFYQI
jgi:hypothetical protein